MSLLNDNTIPAIPTPSTEILLEQKVNRIQNLSKETFNQLIHTQRQGIVQLWEDPNLTPQEIINALGDNALKVFQFHGALTSFINSLAALDGVTVELKLPTNAFTEVDGVITVTEDPYIP